MVALMKLEKLILLKQVTYSDHQNFFFFIINLHSARPTIEMYGVVSCSGDSVTLAWKEPTGGAIGAIAHYILSATPLVENCDPNCTVDPSTSQFTFTGLEAEVRYTLTLRADNCEGTQQEGLEYNVTDVAIQSECFLSH